jgi:hypothetical protein
MDLRHVAVATITWARTDAEASLLERSLEALLALDLPVCVTNRDTGRPFLDRLQRCANLHLTSGGREGLVPQVRDSVVRALQFGRPFILYTEPDKLDFFTTYLRDFVAGAPQDDDVGIVLAARSSTALATFPPMQRYTEGVINELCRRVIGIGGDYCYGPFLMQAAVAHEVPALPPDLGWGWRPATFRAARRHRLRIVHAEADYRCPEEQRDEDEAECAHRLRQLSQSVRGLVE